jgi:hypothetical protein
MNDVLLQVLWTRYFIRSQGYEGAETVVYQYNQSSILLEKNGRLSSGKRTRHINICYFFVADRIKAKELTVEYCPTGNMLADLFNKPLQGKALKNFRDIIMSINQQDDCVHRSVLGNNIQHTENLSARHSSVRAQSARPSVGTVRVNRRCQYGEQMVPGTSPPGLSIRRTRKVDESIVSLLIFNLVYFNKTSLTVCLFDC